MFLILFPYFGDVNTGTRLEWCNPAHREQSPSADTLCVKIFVSPSSPCSGILLQIHPVHFFSIWLKKTLPASQVKPGSRNKGIYPSAGFSALQKVTETGTEGTLRRCPAHPHSCNEIVLPPSLISNLSLSPRCLYSRFCCSALAQGSRDLKEQTQCLHSTTH